MKSDHSVIPPLPCADTVKEDVSSDRLANAAIGTTAGVTAGAAIGSAAVLGGFLLVGLTPAGPIAGSLFAANMGTGLAAGSYMAMAQATAMSAGVYYSGATVGGAAGGIIGGWAGYWFGPRYNNFRNGSSPVFSGSLQNWGRSWYVPKVQHSAESWADYNCDSKLFDSRAWFNYVQEKQPTIGNWAYWYGSNTIKNGKTG